MIYKDYYCNSMFLLISNNNIPIFIKSMLLLKRNNNIQRGIMKTKKSRMAGKLFYIAESQQGYFTSKQAESCGYSKYNHPYHVKDGTWIREGRGIYRLKNFPTDQVQGQYVFFSLWSRNKNDKPQAVISHETALAINELSDLMPSKIHMSVPKKFQRWAAIPKILKLYYRDIDPNSIEDRGGYFATTPLDTIVDLLKTKHTSEEFIEQAIREALNRGFFSLTNIKQKAMPNEIRERIIYWLSPDW